MRSTHRTRPSRPARTDGAPFATYAYDAYGADRGVETTATAPVDAPTAAAIAAANVLRYAGYAYDAYAGLYYLSQRYYDPATASFTTKDPARADGEQSPYQYCGGDPVNQVDPSGAVAIRIRDFTKLRWRLAPIDITNYIMKLYRTNYSNTLYVRNQMAMKALMIGGQRVDVSPNKTALLLELSKGVGAAGKYFVLGMKDWFESRLATNHVWDIKLMFSRSQDYTLRLGDGGLSTVRRDDLGNIHFGVVGRAAGLPLNFLKRVAGEYQRQSGTSRPEWNKYYGDDPRDQRAIERGYKLAARFSGSTPSANYFVAVH